MSAGLVLGGRYRLISQLGEGGFGSVWRGYDTRLERHVAVKILHAGVDVPRFKREAHALARLSHPNIVAAYDFGIDGSTAYLVLEMITGRTVADELAATRAAGQVGLPVDRVLHLADQVLAGLGAAHAAGLIHRDLKPANIMAVTGGPEIKIVDFGIARTGDASRMTAVGSVLGTLPYMAPEQFDDAQLDGRVDLYSLGCVLHELLTGVSPYQAKNTAAWIKAHHLQAPGHVRDRRPEVPPGVDQFVQHLLVKDPAGRPADAATARAIAATLPRTSGVAQPVPAMPTPAAPTPAVPPPVVPPPGGPVAAGVGAAAAAVGPMGPGSSAVQSGAQGRRMAIVCRKCGHLNPEGTQFCARPGCGEYLDWGTQVRTGMVSGTAAVPKGLYTQKSAASIRLSSSDLSVAPGASTTTTATVHNGGTQIEEFTVSVGGTAAAWSTVEPATLRIFPGEQADCVIRVAPPRHSSVPAGKSTFTASALSSVHRSLVASANGTLDVGAYRDLRATLVPAQTRGRGRTMHTIELVNDGNVGEAVRLAATDRTATVRFALPPGEIRLLPGAMAVNMPVKPKWRLIGRPQQYQFQVTVTPTDRPTAPGLATPPGGTPVPQRLDGTRDALPLIPSWVVKLATTLAVLVIGTLAAMYATHTGPFQLAGGTPTTRPTVPQTPIQTTTPPSLPPSSPSQTHAYPSDYANEILGAWAAKDRDYLALLTDDGTANEILSWGNINPKWSLIANDGAAGSSYARYFNDDGDYIIIRTSNELTSSQQWHAGAVDTWDQMSFPADPTEYVKKLVNGWTTGNVARMNLLGNRAITAQLKSMTPPSPDFGANFFPAGATPPAVEVVDQSTGTDLSFFLNAAALGGRGAVTDMRPGPPIIIG